MSRTYSDIVVKRTWLKLAENASPSIRAALQAYLNAIQKIGKGKGKRAVRFRQDARMAASQANSAVPCWIMPHYRVSESLPAELGCFDLVIIDEASQSDLTALPSLLRAKKALIVGDDKQVSPEGVGLEEEKILNLMGRFLGNQVKTYRPQMSPDRSIYDLFKVVFAKSAVMLKEHFRCVGPIIEYSKREFYNHELRPLRMPKASERLDPPLIDIFVKDGYRKGDINLPEARFIIDEIKAIVIDPDMAGRSIGVVSLLADKQAATIWERLTEELGPEVMQRHRITCGDARTFQGKERDIMFLSMISAPNEIGAPLSRDTFAQRFNVAASRAKDRMYLVRSVELEHLSEADRLRRSLIGHFTTPFAQDEMRVEDLRKFCESPFEREMYDELSLRGYWVTPQVRVGQYRIDLVIEGHNDTRLAVECDGDRYHGADKWNDDMQRQRVLERAGWVFWRCFASSFIRRKNDMLDDLLKTLAELGIEPMGGEGAPKSVHTERRTVSSVNGRAEVEIPVMPVDVVNDFEEQSLEPKQELTNFLELHESKEKIREHSLITDEKSSDDSRSRKFAVKKREFDLPFREREHDLWEDFSNDDQLGQDLSGEDLSYRDLTGANLAYKDLSNADLTGTDLSGADLRGISLIDANLMYANLTGANLTGADVTRANFCGANLADIDVKGFNCFDANLIGANLANMDLSGANLVCKDLANVNFTGVNLSGANLSGTNLTGASIGRANLKEANLSLATLIDADLGRSDLTRANLTGADLSGANLAGAYLARANLSKEANLSGANLSGAHLFGADLIRADLSNSNLTRADFTDANLTDANLTDAKFTNAKFTNANLTNAVLPAKALKK